MLGGAAGAIAGSLFRRATDLDPGFSTAFAARAYSSFQDVMMGYVRDHQAALAAGRFAAERSIELDPLDRYANAAVGRLHILTRSADDGLVWLDRSVDLSPNYAKGVTRGHSCKWSAVRRSRLARILILRSGSARSIRCLP